MRGLIWIGKHVCTSIFRQNGRMPVRPSPPPRVAEDWLSDLGHTYFGSLTNEDLMHACASASIELGTRRRRTDNQRYLLAQNIGSLLREIVSRASYRAAPGSMDWDVTHCKMSLAESAAAGLERERIHARYYVLNWALKLVYPNDRRKQVGLDNVLFEGRHEQMSILSHRSDAGHRAVIEVLSEIYRNEVEGSGTPPDAE